MYKTQCSNSKKMKFLTFFSTVCMTVIGGSMSACLSSCDCHHFDEPDPGMSVGDILCTDGSVVSFTDYVKSGREAVAIVYNVNDNIDDEIRGYAVYLGDISDEAFSDSIPVSQGTSKDLTKMDGNENTYALYKCDKAGSPMALPVFDLWTFGQSAYIPSVEQLRQIQSIKNFINPRIEAIGGDILPDSPDDCWYWSSTEVEGQDDVKAWLVSMHSGIIQETPKEQKHHCRPVVTIYRHNNQSSGDGNLDDEILNGFRTDLDVYLSIDKTFSGYRDIDSTKFTTRGSTAWGIRYCVAAYRRDETTPYDVKSSYESPVRFSLPPGKYTFVSWADHTPYYDDKSWYFHTDDFADLLLRHKYDYEANDEAKLAYSGRKEHRVSFTSTNTQIDMKPHVAKYKLVATDSADFTPGKVMVYYQDLPASVNLYHDRINAKWSDVSYISSVTGNTLAFDHVLAEDTEITVKCCVEIYDTNNNLRARVRKVEIPLVNGGVTTIRGNFFTTLHLDDGMTGGGITIDPNFEETVEIEY